MFLNHLLVLNLFQHYKHCFYHAKNLADATLYQISIRAGGSDNPVDAFHDFLESC